jgi:hypothetical protein
MSSERSRDWINICASSHRAGGAVRADQAAAPRLTEAERASLRDAYFLFRQPVEVPRDGQMNVALCFIDRFLGIGQTGSGNARLRAALVKGMQRSAMWVRAGSA